MRTRSMNAPKSVTPKKTPPARKSAPKASKTSTAASNELATPETANRRSSSRLKKLKDDETSPITPTTAEAEPGTELVGKKGPGRTKGSSSAKGKAGPKKKPKPVEEEESPKKLVDDAEDLVSEKEEKTDVDNEEVFGEIKPRLQGEETLMGNVEAVEEEILLDKETAGNDDEEFRIEEETLMEEDVPVNETVGSSIEQEEPVVMEVGKSSENEGQCKIEEETLMEEDVLAYENVRSSIEHEEPFVTEADISSENEGKCNDKSSQEDLKVGCGEQMENDDGDDKKHQIEHANVRVNNEAEFKRKEEESEEDPCDGFDEGLEEYDDRVDLGEHEDEEPPDDDIEDTEEETEALEEECRELTDIASERRMKRECDILVSGLDRDAAEEDLRKVFEKIGDVIDVRLYKSSTTNKNKGYAVVKFANKEQAKRALSEMKNPVICGKRCGTTLREENDTLFLGNVCNTWTNEAIKQKLKFYGIEGIENITVVPDVQHEGLSRGFAFLEFYCNADAMLAYKRLQKPDVVFGHPERTAKVAFAEPLREPDPAIMAKVKTVFLDSLPPHWNEDYVRKQLKAYGEIVRIALARNISTAKRKDFGFVDFSTHEAAIACISGVNNAGLGDCNSKTKVRARLSNPLPKTQAVKGGTCGGYRIGHNGSKTSARFGRNFGWARHCFNWPKFQRGRNFNQHEHVRPSRSGPNNYGIDNLSAEFPSRDIAGQGEVHVHFTGGYRASRGFSSARSSRHRFDRSWHDAPGTSWEEPISFRRPPVPLEPSFERPYLRRHYDDPYSHEEAMHGSKRPFYMTDHRPDYVEPSRVRPRLDYAHPEVPFRDIHYRDTYGVRPAGSGTFSRSVGSGTYSRQVGSGSYSRPVSRGPNTLDHHVSNYGAYPPYHGDDRSYRGGYYSNT